MHIPKLRQGTDQAWPQAVHFELGFGPSGIGDLLWRCEGSCGGRVYASGLFGSQEEAEQFAQQLLRAEPDHIFDVQQIKASQVWN